MNIRKSLTQIKNNNLLLFYIWTEFIRRKGVKSLKRNSDFEEINRLYKKKSGGKLPNIEDPTLFSEKMQWLKLNYRDKTMPIAADKFKVRKLVINKGYEHTLNELVAVFENVNDIDIEKLPNQFVLKASHGSGWNLIVNDKNKINWFWWKKILKSWLKHNIFWNGREWVYKGIKPRLVCEKFLKDKSGYLIDYKFHCFNGKPIFIQANNGRGKKQHAQNFYDLDWNFMPFGKDLIPLKEVIIPKPSELENMIKMAKDYAKDYPYVRVDFYEVNKKIIFGELTFFPASGMPDFKPKKYDKVWGNLLTLPKANN
jgi:hypothetical protein